MEMVDYYFHLFQSIHWIVEVFETLLDCFDNKRQETIHNMFFFLISKNVPKFPEDEEKKYIRKTSDDRIYVNICHCQYRIIIICERNNLNIITCYKCSKNTSKQQKQH